MTPENYKEFRRYQNKKQRKYIQHKAPQDRGYQAVMRWVLVKGMTLGTSAQVFYNMFGQFRNRHEPAKTQIKSMTEAITQFLMVYTDPKWLRRLRKCAHDSPPKLYGHIMSCLASQRRAAGLPPFPVNMN